MRVLDMLPPWLRFFARAMIFTVVTLGVLEAFFRVALPAREMPIPLQDSTEKLMRFDPAGPTTGVFTSGRLAQQRSRWNINAQGWNADIAYVPAAQRSEPLVAIVGDSQIEGLYVEWPEHVAAQTAQRLGVAGYAFGTSGFRVSHYARVARHIALKGYQPAAIVYYINRGDFWAAVVNLGGRRPSARAGQQIEYDAEHAEFIELDSAKYRTSRLRRALRKSAFVRYAVFNAGVNPLRRKAAVAELAMTKKTLYPEELPEHAEMIERAADWLLDATAEALPNTRVVFMIDGDRRSIQAGDRPPNRLGASAILERVCARRACDHLDLTPAFVAAHDADGQRFDFAHNYHWSAHGHEIAAARLAEHLTPLIRPSR